MMDRGRALEFMPIVKAMTPRDGDCLVNRWWIANDDRAVAFLRDRRFLIPQCNEDVRLVRRLQEQLYPSLQVIHVPVVYRGHLSDF